MTTSPASIPTPAPAMPATTPWRSVSPGRATPAHAVRRRYSGAGANTFSGVFTEPRHTITDLTINDTANSVRWASSAQAVAQSTASASLAAKRRARWTLPWLAIWLGSTTGGTRGSWPTSVMRTPLATQAHRWRNGRRPDDLNQNTTLTDLYATGTVTDGDIAGGLVSFNATSVIDNARHRLAVTAPCPTDQDDAGGLVGPDGSHLQRPRQWRSQRYGRCRRAGRPQLVDLSALTASITNTYATGAVTEKNQQGYAGGLVGTGGRRRLLDDQRCICHQPSPVTSMTKRSGVGWEEQRCRRRGQHYQRLCHGRGIVR